MLRVGFLPSDFNPMMLMLGEAEDLRLLAGVLRRFVHERTDVRLNRNKDKSEWISFPTPVIIDPETFEAAQKLLEARRPMRMPNALAPGTLNFKPRYYLLIVLFDEQ